MTTHAIEILPAGTSSNAIGVHGIDDENKALLGYLARYKGQTLRNYEFDLRTFQEWTRKIGLLRMLDAERYQLELYVRYLTERGLAPATIGRRFGTVRGFYHFAHVDGLILKDPAAYVKTPKIEHDQQYRTWFETVDMALVLRTATDPLDRAVLHLMFDLALRVGELCSLNVESIDRTSNGVFLRFIGKGGKLAVMQIPFVSLTALDAYLASRSRSSASPRSTPTSPSTDGPQGRYSSPSSTTASTGTPSNESSPASPTAPASPTTSPHTASAEHTPAHSSSKAAASTTPQRTSATPTAASRNRATQ